MAETNTNQDKRYLGYDGLKTVVENVKEYTDNAVDQKSQVQIINSGTTEVLSTLEIYKLTQEEYDKAVEDGTIVENAIYLTPDEDIDLSAYATIDQLNEKADIEHNHEISDVDGLQVSLDEMNAAISGKASSTHTHAVSEVTDLQSKLDTITSSISEKADETHTHDIDDINELQSKLDTITNSISEKADATHSHAISDVADLQSTLDSNLETAKSYTEEKTEGLVSDTEVVNKISTHNTATDAHNDIRVLVGDLSEKVNQFLDVDEETTDQLSEVLQLIENNKGTLESLTTTKVNVSDVVDNLETSDDKKVLSAKQGVVIKALIDALELVVNGKSDSSHAHDDVYYTETEIDTKIDEINSSINGKADSSHAHDDRYYTEEEINEKLDGKANENHAHAISEITDLQSTLDGKAASSHTHSAEEITSGILSIDRIPVITVTKGGTGADTVEGARANLDVYSKSEVDNAVAQKATVQIVIWEEND